MKKKRSYVAKTIVIGISLMALTIGTLNFYVSRMPDRIQLFSDETKTIDVNFPFSLSTVDSSAVLSQNTSSTALKKSVDVSSTNQKNATLQFSLFNKIPLKDIEVNVIPEYKLMVGGQSVGVKMNIKGVLVVGLEDIETLGGETENPGLDAGLQLGDSILEINGTKVDNAKHVQNLINNVKEEEVRLKIKRKQETLNLKIHPVLSTKDSTYKLGLWVRDKTAGIGTLTFYNSATGSFGALGHAITDPDTGVILNPEDGEIIKSKVVSVKQGKAGNPGEIRGIFYESDSALGDLKSNNDFGIYGTAYGDIQNKFDNQLYEIGYQNEIKKGPAYILTTLENDTIQKYEISIEKINRQVKPSTKSMVIKVTDKELLEKSGGIIQGMSGSPIIQNGKIIGAVTHVFVNDPKKGYAVFIEWMLEEAKKTEKPDFAVN